MSFVAELWEFLRSRKKFWLMPIVIMMLIFGGLVISPRARPSLRSSTRCSEHRSRMIVLGISAYYHDSAAAIVRDGVVVNAAQEERFTRKKHDPSFPVNAIHWCLADAGVTASQVDRVAFYDKPFLKFERLLETYLAFAPRGFQIVPHRHAGLAERKAVPEGFAAEGTARDRRRRSARRKSCFSPSII